MSLQVRVDREIIGIRGYLVQLSDAFHPSRSELHVVTYDIDGKPQVHQYHKLIKKRLIWLVSELKVLEGITMHLVMPKQESNYLKILVVLLDIKEHEETALPNNLGISYEPINNEELRGMLRRHDNGYSIHPPIATHRIYDNYGFEVGKHEIDWLFELISSIKNPKQMKRYKSFTGYHLPTWRGNHRLGRDTDEKLIKTDAQNMAYFGDENMLPGLIHEGVPNLIVLTTKPEIWKKCRGQKVVVHDVHDLTIDIIRMYETNKAFVYNLIRNWFRLTGGNYRVVGTTIDILDEIIKSGLEDELSLRDLVVYDLNNEQLIWSQMRTSTARNPVEVTFSEIFQMIQYQEHSYEFNMLVDENVHVIDVSDLSPIELASYSLLFIQLRELGIFGDKWIVVPGLDYLEGEGRRIEEIDKMMYFLNLEGIIINMGSLQSAVHTQSMHSRTWLDRMDLVVLNRYQQRLADRYLQNQGIDDLGDIVLMSPNRFPTSLKLEAPILTLDYRSNADLLSMVYPSVKSVQSTSEEMADRLSEMEHKVEEEQERISEMLYDNVITFAILSLLASTHIPQSREQIDDELFTKIDNQLEFLMAEQLIIEGSYDDNSGYQTTARGKRVVNTLVAAISSSKMLDEMKEKEMMNFEKITRLRIHLNTVESLDEQIDIIEDMILIMRDGTDIQRARGLYHRLVGIYNTARNMDNKDASLIISEINDLMQLMHSDTEKQILETIDSSMEEQLENYLSITEEDVEQVLAEKKEVQIEIDSTHMHHWVPQGLDSMPEIKRIEIDELSYESLEIYIQLLKMGIDGAVPIKKVDGDIDELILAELVMILGDDLIVDKSIEARARWSEIQRENIKQKKNGISPLADIPTTPDIISSISRMRTIEPENIPKPERDTPSNGDLSVLNLIESEPEKILSIPGNNGNKKGNGDISLLNSVKSEPDKILSIPGNNGNMNDIPTSDDIHLADIVKLSQIMIDNLASNNIKTTRDVRRLGKNAINQLIGIKSIGKKTAQRLVYASMDKETEAEESMAFDREQLERFDLLLSSADNPVTYFQVLISRVLIGDLYDGELPKGDGLILLINHVGSISDVNTTTFTANYNTIIEMWEKDDNRTSIMEILHDKTMNELRSFTISNKYIDSLEKEILAHLNTN